MSTVDMAVERLKCEKTSHVDEQPKKKCAPEVAVMDAAPDGCFDCNICLDFVADPVVTICGHLFCWPCIYKWLQPSERSGARQPAERSCPVCKSTLSQDTLVPLYGRGHSGKGDNQDLQIPRRPVSAHRPSTEQHSPSNQHPPMQHPRENYYYPYFNTAAAGYTPSSSPLLGQTRVVHSVAGERPGGHGVGRDAVGVQEPGLDGRLQLEPVSRGELRGEQQEAQEAQEAGDGDGESAATNLALHTLLRHPVPPLVLRGTNILVRDCTYQIHRNRSHLPLSSAFCKGMR